MRGGPERSMAGGAWGGGARAAGGAPIKTKVIVNDHAKIFSLSERKGVNGGVYS